MNIDIVKLVYLVGVSNVTALDTWSSYSNEYILINKM